MEKVSGIKPKEEEKSPLAVLCIDMKRRRSGISTPSCQKLSCNAQGDSSRHDVIAAGGAPSGIPGSVKGLACFDSQLGAAQAAEAGADALGRRKADAWNGGNGGPAIGSGYGYTSGAIGKSTCTTCSITLAACISGRAGSCVFVSCRYVREGVELVLYRAAVVRAIGLLYKGAVGRRRRDKGYRCRGAARAEGSCAGGALGTARYVASLVS